MDLGAGEGRFALSRARLNPAELVLALDANAAAMRDASRRAPANAIFLACAVEAIPLELDGIADLLTIHFPWGSLLRGATGADVALTGRLAALLRPSGQLRALLSAADRDARQGSTQLEPAAVVAAWEAAGLRAVETRPATLADAMAARSAWGQRLLRNPSPGRSALLIGLERPRSHPAGRG